MMRRQHLAIAAVLGFTAFLLPGGAVADTTFEGHLKEIVGNAEGTLSYSAQSRLAAEKSTSSAEKALKHLNSLEQKLEPELTKKKTSRQFAGEVGRLIDNTKHSLIQARQTAVESAKLGRSVEEAARRMRTSAEEAHRLSNSKLAKFDEQLTPSLAATLAGLSLTAAVFLLGFAAIASQRAESTAQKSSNNSSLNGSAEKRYLAKFDYETARRGIRWLLSAFALFVAFLIETLSFDVYVMSGLADLSLSLLDVCGGGGLAAAALFSLGRGTLITYRSVFPK